MVKAAVNSVSNGTTTVAPAAAWPPAGKGNMENSDTALPSASFKS